MNKLQCELCGSTDIVKEGEFYVCQHCGCKYTKEDAKVLVSGKVDVSGSTVKVDSESAEQLGYKMEQGRIKARKENEIARLKRIDRANLMSASFYMALAGVAGIVLSIYTSTTTLLIPAVICLVLGVAGLIILKLRK